MGGFSVASIVVWGKGWECSVDSPRESAELKVQGVESGEYWAARS